MLGVRCGHGEHHLCTLFSVAASASKWESHGAFLQLCLPGDGGLTIPFTKPTLNHSLCLQVVAHSNAGALIISLHMGKSFRSLGPRAIMYF